MATRKKTAKPASNNGTPDPETELRTAAGYGSNNPKLNDLAGNLEESAGELLTTNHGTRVNDNQNSLKAGDRGPTLMEDFILREKITHFDHERIPERVVHARGSGAHGYFQVYQSMAEYFEGKFSPGPDSAHAGVRAFLDRGRLARFHGLGARRARLRGEVLHPGRQL